MAVPKHIVKFAEASMEQAALITFARKLNLGGMKFLEASRATGTHTLEIKLKIPPRICLHCAHIASALLFIQLRFYR